MMSNELLGAADPRRDNSDDLPRRSRRSRRLQRHLRRRDCGELNIVSMIDVFAVLVFFLLLGSSISASRLNALKLHIPADAPPTRNETDNKSLQLTVTLLEDTLLLSDRNGRLVRIANVDAHYDTATLSSRLAAIKAQQPEERRLTLLVGADIAYERIVAVMDAARESPDAPDIELFPLIAIGDAGVPGGRQP